MFWDCVRTQIYTVKANTCKLLGLARIQTELLLQSTVLPTFISAYSHIYSRGKFIGVDSCPEMNLLLPKQQEKVSEFRWTAGLAAK